MFCFVCAFPRHHPILDVVDFFLIVVCRVCACLLQAHSPAVLHALLKEPSTVPILLEFGAKFADDDEIGYSFVMALLQLLQAMSNPGTQLC